MQVEGATTEPQNTGWRWLRLLLLATSLVFVVLLGLVFVHALLPNPGLFAPIDALGAALPVLAVATLSAGLFYAWKNYRRQRRSVLFVTLLTLVILLAHVFIIGLPAADASGKLSGSAGTTFNNDRLSVDSTASNGRLNITVTASGGAPITSLSLASPGLTGPGFASPPGPSSPLLPGLSATGTWFYTGQAPSVNLTYQYANCYASNPFRYGCIMDEVFYVPEAQGMLNGQNCSTTTSDCHMEHPWLSPALMAAGMAYLGEYDAAGWRIVPALLGAFSIPIIFGIAWKLSDDERVASFSALLLAVDVMYFSQSSAGLLDVPMVFFGLAGALVLVRGTKVWKFDEYILAGALLGLAGLSKETAVFMVAGLVGYNLLLGRGKRRERLYTTLKLVLMVGWVFALGLQAYDTTLASPAVPTFINHVGYIFSYGSSLRAETLACQPTTGYWCKFPNSPGGPPILPSDWLLYYTPVQYFATSVTVCPNTVNGTCQGGSYTYVSLAYYGVTNFLETWTTYVWLPIALYFLYRWRKTSTQTTLEQFDPVTPAASPELPGHLRFAAFASIWFLATYLPYLLLFALQRVTYPFYFLPAVPAVAMGASYFITREWFSKWLVPVYLGMAVIFFFVFFPDKSFLPDWLRVIIAH